MTTPTCVRSLSVSTFPVSYKDNLGTEVLILLSHVSMAGLPHDFQVSVPNISVASVAKLTHGACS